MSEKMDLDSIGEIIDSTLEENEVNMLLTMPEGSQDVQVEDNIGLGGVAQFCIILNSIKPVIKNIQAETSIGTSGPEWEEVVDTLLLVIKQELMEVGDER